MHGAVRTRVRAYRMRIASLTQRAVKKEKESEENNQQEKQNILGALLNFSTYSTAAVKFTADP